MDRTNILSTIRAVGHDAWDRPLGRVLFLLAGVVAVAATVTLYPLLRDLFQWALPLGLVVWGGTRVCLYGRDPLSLVAGCLLVLGGLTRASVHLVPMGELTGAVATLVPLLGVFVELFAHHYREQE